MKVLLQKTQDLSFYAGGERWTKSVDEALDFEANARAAQFLRDTHLSGVRIFLSHADTSHDFAIELDKNFRVGQPAWKAVQPEQLPDLPQPYQDVVVITKRLRCVGYIDPQGIWHGVRDKILDEVVRWEPI